MRVRARPLCSGLHFGETVLGATERIDAKALASFQLTQADAVAQQLPRDGAWANRARDAVSTDPADELFNLGHGVGMSFSTR